MGIFSLSRRAGEGIHIYRDALSLEVVVRDVHSYSRKATLEIRTGDETKRLTVPYGSSVALRSDLDLFVLMRYRRNKTSSGRQVVLLFTVPQTIILSELNEPLIVHRQHHRSREKLLKSAFIFLSHGFSKIISTGKKKSSSACYSNRYHRYSFRYCYAFHDCC